MGASSSGEARRGPSAPAVRVEQLQGEGAVGVECEGVVSQLPWSRRPADRGWWRRSAASSSKLSWMVPLAHLGSLAARGCLLICSLLLLFCGFISSLLICYLYIHALRCIILPPRRSMSAGCLALRPGLLCFSHLHMFF